MIQQASIEHLNPEGMVHSPAFTNVVTVSGPAKTIYVGGQNGVNGKGEIVAKGDIGAQTERIFTNLENALAAAGADLGHVIKFTLFIVHGQPLEPGFAVYQKHWGNRPNPPLVTAAMVSALAVPDALVEIEAVAVVPQ